MKLALKSHIGQCLLAACLVFGTVSANAQKAVTPELEKKVTVGMTEAQVKELLGPPLMVESFGKTKRPTYVYRMSGAGAAEPYTAQLYVTFSDGKVRRAGRRIDAGDLE